MNQLLAEIKRRTAEFEHEPIFGFLDKSKLDCERRFDFFPRIIHFVMTLGDVCQMALRDPENDGDEVQKIVNQHAVEDGTHWRWYLNDLSRLRSGENTTLPKAAEFIWGKETVAARRLSYELYRLSYGADPLTKLVILHVVESTFRVAINHLVPIGDKLKTAKGEFEAISFRHKDAEAKHAIWEDSTSDLLERRVGDGDGKALLSVANRLFDCFHEFVDEAHRNCPQA